MKFLIQHNSINPSQLEDIKSAISAHPHEFVGVIPFSHEITSDNEITGTDYIPYGSTLFTTLALEKGWKGLHFNLENFSMKRALTNRSDMLNDGLIDSVYTVEQYLREVSPYMDCFIRPDLDLKHFSGAVMKRIDAADWLKDAMSLPPESGSYAMDPSMLVCVSSPKKIDAEWRYFIVDGKIVSGSMYRCNGQLKYQRVNVNDNLMKEAQYFANGWLPSKCCVMDLALVHDKLKVIEFNCINSSGFYASDVNAIFKALWEYSNV